MQLLGTMRHQVIILILVMPYIHGQEITTLPPVESPTEPPTEPPPSVCPGGFFTPTGSKPCFRLVGEELGSWDEAKKKCSDEGLTMAQPSDESAVELRNYIATELDLSSPVWLGARGDGTGGQFQWLNGTALPSTNKLWLVGAPGTRDTTDHCLTMAVAAWAVASYPDKAYDSGSCANDYRYTLCEEAPASTRAALETTNQIAPPKELRTSVEDKTLGHTEGNKLKRTIVRRRPVGRSRSESLTRYQRPARIGA